MNRARSNTPGSLRAPIVIRSPLSGLVMTVMPPVWKARQPMSPARKAVPGRPQEYAAG
jgi:hypothetical protein